MVDKEELKKCEKQKEEYLAGWQRARADFLNYKKEEMERIGGLLFYAQEEMILKILPVLDNFNLVEKKLPQDLKDNPNIEGIFQIKNQIQDFLKNYGIEEMKVLGEKFDPNFHEVVEEVEIKDKEKGIIVEEIQKGYLIQGRVLRATRVKVAK
ncbi:MAG: nucleotide exchange factor GrpE [Minisyncoccales bacterium]